MDWDKWFIPNQEKQFDQIEFYYDSNCDAYCLKCGKYFVYFTWESKIYEEVAKLIPMTGIVSNLESNYYPLFEIIMKYKY